MKFAKKLLSGVLAMAMCAGLAGCHTGQGTTWIAKVGDTTVPAGVYLAILQEKYYTVTSGLPNEDGKAPKNPLKEQVDGISVSQKITEDAQKSLKEYLAIEQKCQEMNISLSEEEKSQAASMADMYWGYVGSEYTKNGVSKESYQLNMENGTKRSLLFNAIYGEGGTEAVPESELKDKFTKDISKVIMISQDLSTEEDAAAKEETNKKTRENMDKYYKQLQADASTMEEVYYQAKRESAEDPESVEKPEPGTSFTFVAKDDENFEPEVIEAIFAAELGKPVTLETAESVYLFVRYDANENPEDFTTRKNALTGMLREDAFTEKMNGWAEAVSAQMNEKALKRYTPESLDMGTANA